MLKLYKEVEQDYELEQEDMRGYTAYDSDGAEIGEVKDLLADPDENLIKYCLIGTNAIDFAGKDIIVPLRKMDIDDEDNTVHLDITKERLREFPEFKDLGESGLIERVDEFWGSQHYQRPLGGTERYGRKIPVVEEKARVEKEVEKTGEVAVTKEQEVERKPISEEVKGETVEVERRKVEERPLSEYQKEGRDLQPGETVSVPVTEERVRVTKEPVVVEEIVLKKTPTTRQVKTEAELKKEHVEVEERKERGQPPAA